MSRCQLQVGIKPLLFISIGQRELVRVLMYLVYLLIHNRLGLCTPSPRSHVTNRDVTCDVTKCDIPSHAINRNRKEEKRKRNMNIDLAVVASQWFKVVSYDKNGTQLQDTQQGDTRGNMLLESLEALLGRCKGEI